MRLLAFALAVQSTAAEIMFGPRCESHRAPQVTGDEHVPRGEVTFEANLRHSKHNLQGLEVSASHAKRFPVGLGALALLLTVLALHPRTEYGQSQGVRHLSQMAVYPGKGQCASAGFQNPRFVDGGECACARTLRAVWACHDALQTPSRHLTRAELLLFAGGGLGFRWEPLGTTILFHRVDGMEAEVIEELEAARSSTCSGDSEPFDLVCTLDDILNGNSPL